MPRLLLSVLVTHRRADAFAAIFSTTIESMVPLAALTSKPTHRAGPNKKPRTTFGCIGSLSKLRCPTRIALFANGGGRDYGGVTS